MSGARSRLANANDSASLWNYTDSPGWSLKYSYVLRLALIRYGCGNWKDISRHFPYKNHNQLNTQSQILFGQQSLREFTTLHIDPNVIRRYNETFRKDANRKNGIIVGYTAKSKKDKQAQHDMHELLNSIPVYIASKIHVPVMNYYPMDYQNIGDKIEKYQQLHNAMKCCELEMEKRRNGKKGRKLFTVESYVNCDAEMLKNAKEKRKQRKKFLLTIVSQFRESQSWVDFNNMLRKEKMGVIKDHNVNDGKLNTVNLEMKMDVMNINVEEKEQKQSVPTQSTIKRKMKKRKYVSDYDDEDYGPPSKRVKKKQTSVVD